MSLHVWRYTAVSPIDEFSHIDSLIKTSHFERVQVGEQVGEEAMREEACRRLDRADPIPPCDARRLSPAQFQEDGENTAASKFPIYHLVTGLVARVLETMLPGVSSVVTTARLVGGLWIGLALGVTWLVLRELRVSTRAALAAVAIVATTPVVLHTSAIVNADATLLLGGAALLWAVLLWERGALRAWVPIGVAVIALVTESTNLIGVGLAALYVVLRSVRREAGVEATRSSPSRVAVGVALAGVALVAVFGFPRLHRALIGEAPPRTSTETPAEVLALQHVATEIQSGPVTADQIAGEVGALVTPVRRPYVPAFLAGAGTTVLIAVTDWLLLGAAVGAAFRGRAGSRVEALGIAVLLVMVLGGPALALDNARRDVFFAIPPRFGLPIVPALAVLLGDALTKRWAVVVAGLWACFSVAWVTSRLLW